LIACMFPPRSKSAFQHFSISALQHFSTSVQIKKLTR
jgi:hypothetical protein